MNAAKFYELTQGPLVDIYVGRVELKFTLPQKLLCFRSDYFKSLFAGEGAFKETETGRLDLPEDSPCSFQLLVQWLYTGKLDDMHCYDEADWNSFCVHCICLYLLADKYQLVDLKNMAMDRYRGACSHNGRHLPHSRSVDWIYENTLPLSPLRILTAQMLAHRLTIPPSEYREVEGYQIPDYKACFEHDPDVMLDVLRAVRCGLKEELPDPLEGGAELYHEHENDSRSAANPELLKGWSGNENPQMVEDTEIAHCELCQRNKSLPLASPAELSQKPSSSRLIDPPASDIDSSSSSPPSYESTKFGCPQL